MAYAVPKGREEVIAMVMFSVFGGLVLAGAVLAAFKNARRSDSIQNILNLR